MIDLIVYACMIWHPGTCERTITTFEGDVPTCRILVPPTRAKWEADRPKWEVRNMTCRRHVGDA